MVVSVIVGSVVGIVVVIMYKCCYYSWYESTVDLIRCMRCLLCQYFLVRKVRTFLSADKKLSSLHDNRVRHSDNWCIVYTLYSVGY